MAQILGFRVKNYKTLKDVAIGSFRNTKKGNDLTSVTAVIGKNGVGKSSLFDAFGFLADCLKMGVEDACYQRGRGGFDKIRSYGCREPIEFEIYYRQEKRALPITYELAIDVDETKRPFVLKERLRQRRKGQKHGQPYSFLVLEKGKGVAWKGEEGGFKIDDNKAFGDWLQTLNIIILDEESSQTETVELEDYRKLGITTLGSLKQHPRISAFRRFIEDWYLSYFTPDAARGLPLAGPQKHLSVHGDNLANVVQYMEREHSKRFKSILTNIAGKIPGIKNIDTERMPDDRLALRFHCEGFEKPFYAQQMSDGTLKLFTYLLLLEDPVGSPFICVEEPENGLYHKLLETLAQEFRDHTRKGNAQVFITTHQPYLVNALETNEVWVLEKGDDGFSTIRRASEDATVEALVDEGLPLGGLWYSDYLDKR